MLWFLAGCTAVPIFGILYVRGKIPYTDPEAIMREHQRIPAGAGTSGNSQDSIVTAGQPSRSDADDPELRRKADMMMLGYVHELEGKLEAKTNEARRCDIAGTRLHKIFIDLVTASTKGNGNLLANAAYSAVRDDFLLSNPPVPVPDDAPFLNPTESILIRIIDPAGKNRALILGIDRPASKSQNRSERYQQSNEDLDLVWPWLSAVASELHHADENADVDLPVYVWSKDWIHENSLTADRPNWLILLPTDVPSGFPMKQLRALKPANSNSKAIKTSGGPILQSARRKDTE